MCLLMLQLSVQIIMGLWVENIYDSLQTKRWIFVVTKVLTVVTIVIFEIGDFFVTFEFYGLQKDGKYTTDSTAYWWDQTLGLYSPLPGYRKFFLIGSLGFLITFLAPSS